VSTEEDSPTERGRRADIPLQKTSSSRVSLLVMSETGVFTYGLPEAGEVTIGRGEKCDVRLSDAKASRLHVILRIGATMELVDQGSLNGTKVGDLIVPARKPVRLGAGDMITIGRTVLTLKAARTERPPTRVYSEAAFRERFDQERSAAAATQAGLSILQIRLPPDRRQSLRSTHGTRDAAGPDVAFIERLEATLAGALRPTDVVASYTPQSYMVLLPQTEPDVAMSIAGQIRAELRTRELPGKVGTACYPRDGATLDALQSAAAEELEEDDKVAAPSQLDRGAMERLAPLIERVAAGRINVLILGETGVGKEVMARTLHVRSARALGPMVCVNCAALSETLLESEIFGHEKGAFTGATQAKAGLLESANGGTVFLDEVGEMPLSLQAKLLRVLEQREVLRVGSLRPRPIDVRFLAATNRDLETEIRAGRFRQDLFFRLNGISLTIPPLRERLEEIEGLAKAFVEQAAEQSRRQVPQISRPVLALLKRYSWPGNIRELRNVMERAMMLGSGLAITLEHIPAELMGPLVPLSEPPPRPAYRPPVVTLSPDDTLSPERPTASTEAIFRPGMSERERVIAALEACDGNQTHAAKLLGIARRTLIMRIEDYGLPRPRKK
jgi:DNA-binding NtrC family response regulator